MRLRGLICVLLFAASAKAASEEQEVLAVEQQRSDAIRERNVAFLGTLYDDDFTGVAADGREIDRAALLKVLSGGDGSLRFRREEAKARTTGGAVISTGRVIGETPKGERVVDFRYVHLWVRRNGRWKCVFGQGTPVAKAAQR